MEGDRVAAFNKEDEEKQEEEISYLKTHTILPHWLDEFIFKQLKAQYAPDYQRYDSNLDLTKKRIEYTWAHIFLAVMPNHFAFLKIFFSRKPIKYTKSQRVY